MIVEVVQVVIISDAGPVVHTVDNEVDDANEKEDTSNSTKDEGEDESSLVLGTKLIASVIELHQLHLLPSSSSSLCRVKGKAKGVRYDS